MFHCDICGECCRHLGHSLIYKDLDDGTGKCKYLSGSRCSIYDHRPVFCRVDECYEKYFKETMDYADYLQMNYDACRKLKGEE